MSIVQTKEQSEDKQLDLTLRPKNLRDFIGQEKIKRNFEVFIGAAKKRGEPLEHILLHGPSGLGKTTLAHIVACELKANIKVTSGPAIERVGDLGAILTSLEDGGILFIDEIHRLNKLIEEVLYPAMEDYVLDIIIGKGPSAKTLRLNLPRFTLIGATTRIGLLSSPLLSRFGVSQHLGFYTLSDIKSILKRSARILKMEIDEAAMEAISSRSRFTPRVANRLLKRVRDYAEMKSDGKINKKNSEEALKMLEIDALGLETTDRMILEIIINKFSGGPVGLQTLSAASQEDRETISDVYEPFLLQLGLLDRTGRGRVATKAAYEHLGIKWPGEQTLI
ncbi:Holliday junction branch migration DNA helicase RuvB [Patescibacteria group bacterium]|nr:Holliday junction branch migration DNA helicase RuvB [Patescibacteria group bacterium]